MTQLHGVLPQVPERTGAGAVPLARAVLVDPDEVWRRGLRSLLQDAGLVRVLGEAGDLGSGREVVDRLRPELVVVDPSVHGDHRGSLAGLVPFVEAGPQTHVLVVTTALPQALTVELVRRGVQGIVTKGGDAESLVRAVRTTLRGDAALDAASTAALVGVMRDEPCVQDLLTAREHEVLGLVATGLPNRLVGRELFVTEATVKFHVRNIMGKLGVRRRAELVALALREGLV